MKTINLSLAFLFLMTQSVFSKECQMILNGKLKKEDIELVSPYVLYPNDYYHSVIAHWSGPAKAINFINPISKEITCGSNHLITYLEPLKATGYLPEYILTDAWPTVYPDGVFKVVPPQTMFGFGSSSEYPYPEVKFENSSNYFLDIYRPEVKDICDLTKIELGSDIVFDTYMVNESPLPQYAHPTEYGRYLWDDSKMKDWAPVKLTLEDPYISISCNQVYEYNAVIEWPYEFDEFDGACKGGVNRRMEMKGLFSVDSENKITGILNVSKPTVTTYGNVTGYFTGSDFSIEVEGMVKSDLAGNRTVEISYFDGGDGIAWNYTLNCLGGKISNSEFAAAKGYLKVLQREENWSVDNPGYIIYDEKLDSKDYEVNMWGQGKAHVNRTWKRLY